MLDGVIEVQGFVKKYGGFRQFPGSLMMVAWVWSETAAGCEVLDIDTVYAKV